MLSIFSVRAPGLVEEVNMAFYEFLAAQSPPGVVDGAANGLIRARHFVQSSPKGTSNSIIAEIPVRRLFLQLVLILVAVGCAMP